MASPAAVLSVLVKADGIVKTNKQLGTTQSSLVKAEKSTGKLHGTLSKFRGMSPIGGALAVGGAIAEVKSAVKETTALAKTTKTLSANFGLTTKAASEWAAVAKSRGIDGKQLTMGFKGLANATRSAVGGSKASVEAFKALGISQQDLAKHGNDTNFMIHAVADGLGKLPAGTNKAALQAKLFGRTWQGLSPLLRDGSKNLDDQLQLADKYGATLSDKTVKGVSDAAAAQRELALANMGFHRVLAEFVMPAIVAVTRGIADLIGWFRQNPAVLKAAEVAVGVLAAGFLALNAVMLANPATLIVLGIAALAAGLVYAYQKSATFREIVNAAFAAVKAAAIAVWDVAKVVFPAIGKAIVDAWMWVKTATTNVWGAIGPYLKGIFEVLKFLVKTYFLIYKTYILGVWTAVKTATEIIWPVIKAILVGAFDAIKLVATTTWAAIRLAILNPIRDARDTLSDIWHTVKTVASGAWDALKTGAEKFAGGFKDVIVGAFKGAVNQVIGFVNSIIGVINKLPGVNIGKIKNIGDVVDANSKVGKQQNLGQSGHLARGGMINRPTVMVGEEAPRWPEYVLPTNPAYRGRAMGLMQDFMARTGMPGYAQGGILGKLAGGALNAGKGAVSLLASGGRALLGMLPNPADLLPDWLVGTGKWAVGKVGDWIKDKATSFLGGGGGGGPVPSGSARDWLVKALKITNLFSRGNLAALYGRMMQESGGDPRAINLWDINAQQGHPSKGLLQTIDSTFNAYALPGLGNIWNPIANAVAAIRYMIATYGHIVGPSSTGYAKGGIIGDVPFVGSYRDGGTLPADGLYYGHQGETVVPRGGGGPTVHVENLHVGSRVDANSLLERLAFKVATA